MRSLVPALALAVLTAGPAATQPVRLIPPDQTQQDQQLPAQQNTMPLGRQAPAPMPAAPTMIAPVPGGGLQVETQQLQPLPAPASAPASAAAEAPADGKAPDFVIQPLKAPDPSSAGLLDDSNGGLGSAMWQKTSRSQALQAVGVLPTPVAAPALRDLQRRLLLTIAEVPPGNDVTPSILGMRVAQLMKLGRINDAERLVPSGATAPKDSVFKELPFNLALLKNDVPQACEIAAAGLRDEPSATWQKAAVFCRYIAKNIPGGDLALSLWRDGPKDANEPADPAFGTLASVLRGDARAKIDSFGGPVTPLHFAMLRASGRPLPKDTLDMASPAVLIMLAGYDKADAETRLMATERAVSFGALPPELLAEAYAAVEISDAQRATLIAGIGSGKEKSVRAAALIYQQAKATTEPKTRAELIRRAYDLSAARNLLLTTAAVYKPLLVNLTPNENSIHAAPAVIRMALAAGDLGLARLWRTTLMALPPERDNAGDIVATAWPLLLIAGEDGEWRDSRYEAWWNAQDELSQQDRIARAAQLLTLAEASGISVPPERWDSLLNAAAAASARVPPTGLWRNLQRAAMAKAKAETIALSLAMLGGNGSLDADGQSLATALEALRAVGLIGEARQIALEAALLRGF